MNNNLQKPLENYVQEEFQNLFEIYPSTKLFEDWNNLEKILKNIIEENNGNFPSQRYLNSHGYSTLSRAIWKYHGGFPTVRTKMGFKVIKRINGYWSENKVIEEAKRIMKENKWNKLPDHRQLVTLGYSDLTSGIQKNGGYSVIRDKLGQKNKQKKQNIWKDKAYVMQELEKFMNENKLDFLPSYLMLQKLGYSSLASAIYLYHGGIRSLRKERGEKVIHEPREWEEFSYIKEQTQIVMEENNLRNLPCIKDLTEMGYGALAKGIVRYHGGMRSFRKKLELEQISTATGTWSLDYTVKIAREAINKLNVNSLPSSNFLRENGYSNLASAIQRNFGFRNFRELLGEEQKKIDDGLLKDFEYVKKRVLTLMQEHGWKTIPSNETFRNVGESGLCSAIHKYHGGIHKFRELIEQKQLQKPLNYWKNPENIKREALEIMRELETNSLPGSRYLNENGYANFIRAVQKYHGGMKIVRKRFMNEINQQEPLESFLEDYIKN